MLRPQWFRIVLNSPQTGILWCCLWSHLWWSISKGKRYWGGINPETFQGNAPKCSSFWKRERMRSIVLFWYIAYNESWRSTQLFGFLKARPFQLTDIPSNLLNIRTREYKHRKKNKRKKCKGTKEIFQLRNKIQAGKMTTVSMDAKC